MLDIANAWVVIEIFNMFNHYVTEWALTIVICVLSLMETYVSMKEPGW